jgi:hypothetical protein
LSRFLHQRQARRGLIQLHLADLQCRLTERHFLHFDFVFGRLDRRRQLPAPRARFLYLALQVGRLLDQAVAAAVMFRQFHFRDTDLIAQLTPRRVAPELREPRLELRFSILELVAQLDLRVLERHRLLRRQRLVELAVDSADLVLNFRQPLQVHLDGQILAK